MSAPTFIWEVAFATQPAATPTWTTVTPYSMGCASKRGRQKELDLIDAGTATVRFNNSDRRFDPTHTGGLESTVTNSSFSTGITGWSESDAAPASLTPTWDALSYEGAGSLKLVNTTAGEDDFMAQTLTGLLPSTTYRILAWVNVTAFTAGAVANRGLGAYDTADPGATEQYDLITAATTGWVQKTVSVTTTSAVGSHSIAVRLYGPQATLYWDRVLIVPPSAPYYPNVLSRKRLRWSAVHNTVTYRLFSGFVQAWPQTGQGPNVGFSDVSVTDAFLPLSRVDVGENTTWPREFSGARITRILDEAGWPAADRSIDTGYSEIAEVTFALGAGVTALNAIREVAGAELGTFFVNGAGVAVFHDRHHRKAASYLTSQATFSDGLSAGIPYQSIVLDTDADRIWNDVQVTATGGETQRVENATSQDNYFRNTMARQVPLARDTEAADQAAYLLAQYKDPQNRLTGITFTPATDAEWVQALGRELGDHITVKRHPQGVGAVITQECSIEAIEHAWTPHGGDFGLKTTWLLSTPAYTAVDWWILADATYGVEGTTTKLVY